MIEKICTGPECIHEGSLQQITNFYKDRNTKDGYQYRCIDCRKAYNKSHREQTAKYNKWYKENNKEKIKQIQSNYTKSEAGKIRSKKHRNKNALYETYHNQISYCEEIRKDPNNNDYIQVKCSVCRIWMNITNSQIKNRICCLNNQKNGESKFYCSNNCKQNCDVFGQVKNFKSDKQKDYGFRDRTLQHELKQIVFERDNYTCVKCYSKENLICHHVEGIRWESIESADIDKCITVCDNCHKKIHDMEGCQYHELKCNK